jgi:hypothetical protein
MSTQKEATSFATPSYITLIIAPGIPKTEVKVLKAQYQKAITDPNYTLVMNYNARVDQVEIPKGARLFITARGIPTTEVPVLRKLVDNARKASRKTDRLVVLNYECRIDVVC